MYGKIYHDKYRDRLSFAFFPHRVDGEFIWLRSFIRRQQYITGKSLLPEMGEIPVHKWKTIAKYGSLPKRTSKIIVYET